MFSLETKQPLRPARRRCEQLRGSAAATEKPSHRPRAGIRRHGPLEVVGPTCQGQPDLGSTGTDSGAYRGRWRDGLYGRRLIFRKGTRKGVTGRGLRPACIPIGSVWTAARGGVGGRERRPAKPTRSMLGRASPLASGQLASEEHDSVAHWAA